MCISDRYNIDHVTIFEMTIIDCISLGVSHWAYSRCYLVKAGFVRKLHFRRLLVSTFFCAFLDQAVSQVD